MSVKITNIDLMKPSSEIPMETLMQLGKFSQPSNINRLYVNNSESSDIEFSNDSATPPSLHSPHNFVPSTSSISFVGNPVQESRTAAAPPLPSINVASPPIFRTTNHEFLFANSLQKRSSMDAMREMIFRMAMMQPIHIDPESVKPPKRKNVKISKDPQSVAARHRRERISEKIRILQRLVPGGTKMDTASMLDEAAHYLKFLKKQVQALEQTANDGPLNAGIPITMATSSVNYSNLVKACQHQHAHVVGSMQMLSFET